jgi:hypothetical protein
MREESGWEFLFLGSHGVGIATVVGTTAHALPMAIHVGTSFLEGFGRAIAAPPGCASSWRYAMGVATLRSMIVTDRLRRLILNGVAIIRVPHPGVFIVHRRAIRPL